MSRRQTKTKPRPKTQQPMVRDSFTNVLARMGTGVPNLLESTEYPMTRLTKDWPMMDSLYRSHWVARRIIDVVPGDMVKNWYKLTCQVDPDALARFVRMERRVKVKAKILQGLRLGRLYGGAGALMIIGGHEGVLDQPLDYNTIAPGAFQGLLILDRWTGIEPGLALVEDPVDPEFGLPDYYTIMGVGVQRPVRVHHSRILRFEGRDLPEIERQMENYWGASEIEHVFDELKKRDNTSWNMALLVFHANLRILKMDQMEQVLGVAPKEVQQELYAALLAQNQLMSNMGLMVTGKEEDVTSLQYTFSGLADVYEQFMMDLAGAAEMPVTKLFGRSPAGMDATGESDMQNYYDSIEEKQEAYLAPVLDKLLPVMACSEWGGVPDDLDWEFNPARRPSEEEKKTLSAQINSAIFDAYNAGLISQRMALKEMRQSTELTGMWSNITDEDIDRADDNFGQMEEGLLGGFGGGGGFEEGAAGFVPSFDGLTRDGGEGSGNFNHAGRPGEVGGSAVSGSGGGSDFDPEAEREKIKNGTYTSKIVKGKQRKHIPGTREFEQNAAKMERENPGSKPAILKASAQNLIKKHKGTGEIKKQTGSNMPREFVVVDKVIGQTWVQSRQKYVDTKAFEIIYSIKGTHIIPVNDGFYIPKEEKE